MSAMNALAARRAAAAAGPAAPAGKNPSYGAPRAARRRGSRWRRPGLPHLVSRLSQPPGWAATGTIHVVTGLQTEDSSDDLALSDTLLGHTGRPADARQVGAAARRQRATGAPPSAFPRQGPFGVRSVAPLAPRARPSFAAVQPAGACVHSWEATHARLLCRSGPHSAQHPAARRASLAPAHVSGTPPAVSAPPRCPGAGPPATHGRPSPPWAPPH